MFCVFIKTEYSCHSRCKCSLSCLGTMIAATMLKNNLFHCLLQKNVRKGRNNNMYSCLHKSDRYHQPALKINCYEYLPTKDRFLVSLDTTNSTKIFKGKDSLCCYETIIANMGVSIWFIFYKNVIFNIENKNISSINV